MHNEKLRDILSKHSKLSVEVSSLDDNADLYEAGLTSLTTVNLMLAIEDHFEIEFEDAMLSRATFSSINALSEAVGELLESA